MGEIWIRYCYRLPVFRLELGHIAVLGEIMTIMVLVLMMVGVATGMILSFVFILVMVVVVMRFVSLHILHVVFTFAPFLVITLDEMA